MSGHQSILHLWGDLSARDDHDRLWVSTVHYPDLDALQPGVVVEVFEHEGSACFGTVLELTPRGAWLRLMMNTFTHVDIEMPEEYP